MLSKAVVAIARILAIVLVGAGMAGIASVAGARQVAFLAGVVAIGVGGVFVLASNQASWLPVIQRPATGSAEGTESASGLFGRGYGVAAVVGLLGTGLVIGSAIDVDVALLVAGVAGVAALVFMTIPGRTGQT